MPQTELIGGTNMVAQQKPVRGLIQKIFDGGNFGGDSTEERYGRKSTKRKVRKERRGYCRERLERREIRTYCTYISRSRIFFRKTNWRGTCAGIPPTVCGVGWDSVYVGEHLERDVRFFVRRFLCG